MNKSVTLTWKKYPLSILGIENKDDFCLCISMPGNIHESKCYDWVDDPLTLRNAC